MPQLRSVHIENFRCLRSVVLELEPLTILVGDGGWQTYLRQSMPGYDNPAFAEDGTPMKNWWPFLFY
jgi:hypothetical protein